MDFLDISLVSATMKGYPSMKNDTVFKWNLPADYLLRIIPALIFLKKRNFWEDSIQVLKSGHIKIDLRGSEYIPKEGPVLFLVNHYSAPEFSALWIAMSLSAICPKNITWVMTDAWTFPKRKFRKLAREISHFILTRIAKVYGFFTFQPVSDDPTNVIEQALSIRRILHFARDHPDSMVSIAPEGRDMVDGTLGNPPPGAGLLIKAFTKVAYRLLPVGFYATPGTCHLNFGKPLLLNIRKTLKKDEIDQQVNQKVMQSIGELLPEKLRNKKIEEKS